MLPPPRQFWAILEVCENVTWILKPSTILCSPMHVLCVYIGGGSDLTRLCCLLLQILREHSRRPGRLRSLGSSTSSLIPQLGAHLWQSKCSVVAQHREPQEEGQNGDVYKGELLAHKERPIAVKAPLQPPQLLPQCISSFLLSLDILPAHTCLLMVSVQASSHAPSDRAWQGEPSSVSFSSSYRITRLPQRT